MADLHRRCGYSILPLWLLSFFFLFFLLILSGRRLDVYHTSTHDVVLVQIWNAGLKCAACGSLKIRDAKITKKICHLPSLSGYIFATKACMYRQLEKTC